MSPAAGFLNVGKLGGEHILFLLVSYICFVPKKNDNGRGRSGSSRGASLGSILHQCEKETIEENFLFHRSWLGWRKDPKVVYIQRASRGNFSSGAAAVRGRLETGRSVSAFGYLCCVAVCFGKRCSHPTPVLY